MNRTIHDSMIDLIGATPLVRLPPTPFPQRHSEEFDLTLGAIGPVEILVVGE